MSRLITFPGLGLEFNVSRVAIEIFGRPIYWYGAIIAIGFLLALCYCYRKAPKFGIKSDDLVDLLFFAVPLSIVGARIYYILFNLDFFRMESGELDWGAMVRIWDGGLAIYGAVIVSFLTLAVFCKVHKVNFFAFADVGVYGLLIGQCVGRWGNFVNVEAYGAETALPWRMGIEGYVGDNIWRYMEVHPTFLYESLWNLMGLVLLIVIAKKWRKFDGQIMLSYFLWYGVGRGVIEGLRTDSLYFFSTTIRVSQVLGFATALVAAVLLIWHLAFKKHDPSELYVSRLNAEAAETESHQNEPPQLGDIVEEEQHGGDTD